MIRTALVMLCMAACSKSDHGVKASPETRPAAIGSETASCALAMIVDTTGVSIGTPAGTCHAVRVGGKPDVAWVETELRRLRSAFASCSVDALLVAETGPYQELITLMDIAVKTGFVDIGVGDTSDLRFAVTVASDTHCKLPSPPPEKPVATPVPQTLPAPPLSPDEARKIAARLEEQVPLPPPPTKGVLQEAPVIIVTKTEITLRGQVVASVDVVAKDPQSLKPLADLLHADDERTKHKLAAGGFPPEIAKACEAGQHGIRPLPGAVCPLGLAILQADEATDMRVINALLHAAKGAGFDNLLFAVKNI